MEVIEDDANGHQQAVVHRCPLVQNPTLSARGPGGRSLEVGGQRKSGDMKRRGFCFFFGFFFARRHPTEGAVPGDLHGFHFPPSRPVPMPDRSRRFDPPRKAGNASPRTRTCQRKRPAAQAPRTRSFGRSDRTGRDGRSDWWCAPAKGFGRRLRPTWARSVQVPVQFRLNVRPLGSLLVQGLSPFLVAVLTREREREREGKIARAGKRPKLGMPQRQEGGGGRESKCGGQDMRGDGGGM